MLRRFWATVLHAHGYRAFQRSKWHNAVAHLSHAIRVFPDYPGALCDRGVAYQGIGDHRLATLDFSRAIELDPTLAMAYYNRGISAKLLGEYDWAIDDHTKAIALKPTYSNAYGEQGVVYACKRELDLAIVSLTQAIKLDPHEPTHLRHRGYVQFDRGNFAASADDLRRSLDRFVDPYAMLYCYLARARIGEAAKEELQADSRRLMSKSWPLKVVDLYLGSCTPEMLLASLTEPDELAEAHFYVGQWHLLQGNQTEAIKAFREAVERCPRVFTEYMSAVAELGRLGCNSRGR